MDTGRGDTPTEAQRGDVVSIDYADPDPAPDARTGPFGRLPEPDERVAIRLAGFPFAFVVRVATDPKTGPIIVELTITSDDGTAVDHEVLQGIPARRLAYSARQWIARAGGQVGIPGDVAQTWTRPDEAADDTTASKASRAARIADKALALGLPVRSTVAAELGVSTRTVDRLLKRAKAEGWFDDQPLPKRPQPPQHDTTTTTAEES